MNDHRIQPLPPDVAAKIKSSTLITHLNGVIVELVKNALDANAHTVFVTVDYRRGGCVVEDDGDGIPPAEFDAGGGLGKAHHTSKFHSQVDVYGRRGLFLASLSSLALLTITSNHIQHPSTNTIIFHHSTPVARLTPAPVHQRLRFSDHGTSATVNDLFGNMPVRVRNRALTLLKSDELDRQWDELRQLLVSFMIANKRLLKLVLSGVDKDRKLTLRPRTPGISSSSELDLPRITSILAQAGLTDFQNGGRWYTVSARVPHVSICAAISLVPCPTRKVQFISFGIDPVFPRNQANVLYNEVNRLFASSDFGTVESFPSATADDTPGDGPFDGHIAFTKSMPKAVNKWPMFYICINTSHARTDDEELPESDESLQHIIDILTAMINEFLQQHNMRPRAGKRKRKESPAQDGDTAKEGTRLKTVSSTEETLGAQLKLPSFSRPVTSPHFGDWSRVKSGGSHSTRSQSRSLQGRSTQVSEKDPTLPEKSVDIAIGVALTESRKLRDTIHPTAAGLNSESSLQPEHTLDAQHHHTNEPETDQIIPWTDPYTGRSHWINSRTGQSVNMQSPAALALTMRPRSTGCVRNVQTAARAKRPSSALEKRQNTWLDTFLDKWKNPVFSRSEQPIGFLDIIDNHDERRSGAMSRHTSGELCAFDSFGASKFRGKLRKRDLTAAEVISQVDQKFILVKMNPKSLKDSSPGDASTLVLVDQHAADERCRVERLFEQFFQGASHSKTVQTILVDPITFDIPPTEARLFGRHAGFFSLWGVQYTVETALRGIQAAVIVTGLPTLIAERCRTEPDLLASLIRGEIWKREDNGRGPRTPSRPGEGHGVTGDSWVDRLTGCPQGILELLNSRACRTAIMFNDALSTDECHSLVNQLTSCVFPFQCAHGRPSMVPILDLHGPFDGAQPDEYAWTRDDDPGFIGAFKRWQSTSNT